MNRATKKQKKKSHPSKPHSLSPFPHNVVKVNMSATWQKIVTTDADGGLKSCFDANGVDQRYRDLLKQRGIQKLRDFLGFDETDYKSILDEVWKEVEELKNNYGARASLRATWETATTAIKHIESSPSSSAAAPTTAQVGDPMEAELDERVVTKMKTDWVARYNFVVDDHLRPVPALVAKIRREFEKFEPTAIPVWKWLAKNHEEEDLKTAERQVAHRVKLVEDIPRGFDPKTLLQYQWGMLTLANAMAFAGNYEVNSFKKHGERVLMMPWDVATNYVYSRIRITTDPKVGLPPDQQLPWLIKNDLITRKMMCSLVRNEKYPAGEALMEAVKECKNEWTVVRGGHIVGVHEGLCDTSALSYQASVLPFLGGPLMTPGGGSRDRERSARGGDKGAGKGKGPRTFTIGSQRLQLNGRKLCGAYNSKRGCKGKGKGQCPQHAEHRCAYVIDEEGNVCDQSNHGFCNHRG